MSASGKDGSTEGGKSRDEAEIVLLEKSINEKEEGKGQEEQVLAHMLAPAHLLVDPAVAAVEIIPDSSDEATEAAEAAEAARDFRPQGKILISRRPSIFTIESHKILNFQNLTFQNLRQRLHANCGRKSKGEVDVEGQPVQVQRRSTRWW